MAYLRASDTSTRPSKRETGQAISATIPTLIKGSLSDSCRRVDSIRRIKSHKVIKTALESGEKIDRGLPDGDGLALLPDLRQQKPSRATVVLTALDDPIDIARALDDGADDYAAKPFEPIELVTRAKAVLRRFSLDRGAVRFK